MTAGLAKLRHSESALTERRYRKAPTKKLLRKKKNESWTMRRFENVRSLTSPTLSELEETCYEKSFSLVFSG